MKKAKHVLAVWICLCIAAVFLPAAAFATEENTANVGTKDAFLEALNDSTITTIRVTADLDLSDANVLDVSGRTIDLNGNKISASNFTLIFEGSNFMMKNGTFDAKGGSYALFIGDMGTTDNVVVDNITMIGGVNIFNATNVVLKNVNVAGADYYAVWCDEHGQATIESGSFKTNGVAVLGLTSADTESSLNIKGGSFMTDGKPLVLKNEDKFGKPIISGGTFDVLVEEEYCADNFIPVKNEDGSFGVCNHADEEIRNAKEATCTESGYTGDTYCKKCGLLLQKGTEISASGHSFGTAWKSDDTNHWHECSCGEKDHLAAHSFGDWTVTKAATAAETGIQEKACTVCGYKVTKTLPVIDANQPTTPQTGVSSESVLWIVLSMLFLSAALTGSILFVRKRGK